MEITCWGHSGVRLDRAGAALAIDPGAFTDEAMLAGVQAVLVTHEHPDHVQPNLLAEALDRDPQLEVWAPDPVVEQLHGAGLPADRVHATAEGDAFTAAGFAVRALGRDHALIHPAIPVPANRAYLIDSVVLHPGDSFTPPPSGTAVHTLLLPVAAPWLKLAEAIDYLQAVNPTVVVPIHDAVLSDPGRALVDRIISGLAASAQYRRLDRDSAVVIPER